MPVHVTNLITAGLNKIQKPISGSKILIIGVAYKKDINDYRESPALDIIELLQKSGSMIEYYDPYVPELTFNKKKLISIKNINVKKLKEFDACVVITNHSNVDYKLIADNCKLIIDTRDSMKLFDKKYIKARSGLKIAIHNIIF